MAAVSLTGQSVSFVVRRLFWQYQLLRVLPPSISCAKKRGAWLAEFNACVSRGGFALHSTGTQIARPPASTSYEPRDMHDWALHLRTSSKYVLWPHLDGRGDEVKNIKTSSLCGCGHTRDVHALRVCAVLSCRCLGYENRSDASSSTGNRTARTTSDSSSRKPPVQTGEHARVHKFPRMFLRIVRLFGW